MWQGRQIGVCDEVWAYGKGWGNVAGGHVARSRGLW